MTLQEAADQLGVHYMTAYRYIRQGRLPATREGAEWRIRAVDVQRPAQSFGEAGAAWGSESPGRRQSTRAADAGR